MNDDNRMKIWTNEMKIKQKSLGIYKNFRFMYFIIRRKIKINKK